MPIGKIINVAVPRRTGGKGIRAGVLVPHSANSTGGGGKKLRFYDIGDWDDGDLVDYDLVRVKKLGGTDVKAEMYTVKVKKLLYKKSGRW